jgi:hypothetical protein
MIIDARKHHERPDALKMVLSDLRKGIRIIKKEYETGDYLGEGSRVAPAIEQLRNAYGFNITGDGSEKNPYELIDKNQWPRLIMVTDEIKDAYYRSSHWLDIRQKRFEMDGFACTQCKDELSILHCHHITYEDLFSEDVRFHLQTLCEGCHKHVHKMARIKFPSGLTIAQVVLLGFEGSIEDWLRPPEPEYNNPNYKLVQKLLPFEASTHAH